MKEFREGPRPPYASPRSEATKGKPSANKKAQPATDSIAKSSVMIHTMQDDLSRFAGSRGVRQAPDVPPPTPHTQPALQGQARAEGRISSTKSAMPLPPKPSPGRRRGRRAKSRRALLIGVLGILVLMALGSGAWFVLSGSLAGNRLPAVSDEPPAMATAVLPADAEAVVGYVIANAQDRESVMAAWDDGREPTLVGAVAGDPRLLLVDADVSELYYVLLPNEPRPYLLVPATAAMQQLFAKATEASSAMEQGWLIVHPLSADNYLTAVGQRSLLDDAGANTPLTTTAGGAPFRLHVATSIVQSLRRDALTSQVATGLLQNVALAGRLRLGGVELSGTGTVLSTPLSTSAANQQLLTLLPANASLIRLGASLSIDVAEWQSASNALAASALKPPAVQQLLAELAVPYALYATVANDIGLVVEVPPELQGSLQNGDPVIEQALAALIPLLTGSENASAVTFNDGQYGGVVLRYANLEGSSLALDYAVTGTHVMVATSKDAMFNLIDTVGGQLPSATESALVANTTAIWGAIPEAPAITFTTISLPKLQALLPQASSQPVVSLGIAAAPGATKVNTVTLQGALHILPGITPGLTGAP